LPISTSEIFTLAGGVLGLLNTFLKLSKSDKTYFTYPERKQGLMIMHAFGSSV
jgi:hypothetical protein